MDSILVNVYVFIVIFGVLTALIVIVAFGLLCCLEEVKRRRVKRRERYLKDVKTLFVTTSAFAGATKGVPEK